MEMLLAYGTRALEYTPIITKLEHSVNSVDVQMKLRHGFCYVN